MSLNRYDPYKNFRFRVKWDGRYVAGVSKVSALTRTTPVMSYRAGGDPSTLRRTPGQSDHQAITLERGVTHDSAFEQWANKVWDYQNSTTDDLQHDADDPQHDLDDPQRDFRKDIIVELYNQAGQIVEAFKIHRCWPSGFTGMPDLNGDGDAVAIQTLKLENEGWERDTSVADTGDDFTEP